MNNAKRLINILMNGSMLVQNPDYQKQLENENTAIAVLKFGITQNQITKNDYELACDFLNISSESKHKLDEELGIMPLN